MANQKEIRHRIKSVQTTQQMTRAMKMVAAAKLRRAQDAIMKLRPYANKMGEIMRGLAGNLTEELESPFAKVRPVENVLVIVVSSNRGLCGGFNTNLLKVAFAHVQEKYSTHHAAGKLHFICIGKKAFEYFTRRKFSVIGGNTDLLANISFENVAACAQGIMNEFEAKKWDKVDLIYNEFKNVMTQNRKVDSYLPVQAPENTGQAVSKADFIFEPSKKEILESLIPRSLKLQLFKAILDSNAAEQGSRMTAMDTATENAADLLKALKLEYNRARQATITKEILEIVGGAEALASGK